MYCPESGALFNYLTGSSNQILSRGVNTEPNTTNSVCDRSRGTAAGSLADGALEERLPHFHHASQQLRCLEQVPHDMCIYLYILPQLAYQNTET